MFPSRLHARERTLPSGWFRYLRKEERRFAPGDQKQRTMYQASGRELLRRRERGRLLHQVLSTAELSDVLVI